MTQPARRDWAKAAMLALGLAAAARAADPWPAWRGDAAQTGRAAAAPPALPFEILWETELGAPTRSSPVIGDTTVYIGSDTGAVHAIRLTDGAPLWRAATGAAVEAPPLLTGEGLVVVATVDGDVMAFSRTEGAARWRTKAGDRVTGSANLWRSPDGRSTVLVGSYDGLMYGLDASTGEKRWTYETGNMINGSPAVWADMVMFGGCDARLHLIRASDGVGLAMIDVGSYVAASPAAADGRAYVGHYGGALLCADTASGKILWEYANDERGGAFMSAPALASDRVLIGGRDGRLHAVERSTGKRLWLFRGRGDFDASPIIWGNLVAAATTRGMLYVVRLADGEELWSHDLGAGIEASPAVADGRLVLAGSDGRLVAFGRTARTEEKP